MAKKTQKLTKKQKALLREVEKDPEASNYEIDKRLNSLGVIESDNYSYQVVKRNKDIAAKIANLREKYELQIIKKVPKANKVIDKHLKDDSLDAAKLVYRHALPVVDESKRPVPPQQVNIQAIQNIIYNDMSDKDKDTIDVTST